MHLRSIALFTVCACTVLAQQPAPADNLSGDWILSADLFGTTVYLRMELKQDGEKLSGKYTGDKITAGTMSGDSIHSSRPATMAPAPTSMGRLKTEPSWETWSKPTRVTRITRRSTRLRRRGS